MKENYLMRKKIVDISLKENIEYDRINFCCESVSLMVD